MHFTVLYFYSVRRVITAEGGVMCLNSPKILIMKKSINN
jgi:hypothetical protein